MGFPPQGTTPITETRATYIDRIPDIEAETDKIPAVEHETEWSTDPNVDSISSLAEEELTPGDMGTLNYPSGATEIRVILLPIIMANNQAANTHLIGLKVQYSVDLGAWTDIIDLTAMPPMGLVNLIGAAGGFSQPLDVTMIIEDGSSYRFRFAVDSDNAGQVHYTTSFVLLLVYTM